MAGQDREKIGGASKRMRPRIRSRTVGKTSIATLSVWAMAAAVLPAAVLLAPVASAAPAGSSSCKPVELVAVPGTWETDKNRDPNQSQGLLREITNPIEAQAGALVNVYYVPYIAEVGAIAGGVSAGGSVEYSASKADGVNTAIQHTQDKARQCPGTKFAYIGYSQGADVAGDVAAMIGNGRVSGIGPESVLGVGLVADPSRSGNASYSGATGTAAKLYAPKPPGTTQKDKAILVGPQAEGSGMAGSRQLSFNGLEGKVVTVCAPSDMACATPDTDNVIRRVATAGASGGFGDQVGTGAVEPLAQLKTLAERNIGLLPDILSAAANQDVSAIPGIMGAVDIQSGDVQAATTIGRELVSFATELPGIVQSLMNSSPEEIAEQIALAASYGSSHTSYGNFKVDGGMDALSWISNWLINGANNAANGKAIPGTAGSATLNVSDNDPKSSAGGASDVDPDSALGRSLELNKDWDGTKIWQDDLSDEYVPGSGNFGGSQNNKGADDPRSSLEDDVNLAIPDAEFRSTGVGQFQTADFRESNTKALSEEELTEDVEYFSINTDGTRGDVPAKDDTSDSAPTSTTTASSSAATTTSAAPKTTASAPAPSNDAKDDAETTTEADSGDGDSAEPSGADPKSSPSKPASTSAKPSSTSSSDKPSGTETTSAAPSKAPGAVVGSGAHSQVTGDDSADDQGSKRPPNVKPGDGSMTMGKNPDSQEPLDANALSSVEKIVEEKVDTSKVEEAPLTKKPIEEVFTEASDEELSEWTNVSPAFVSVNLEIVARPASNGTTARPFTNKSDRSSDQEPVVDEGTPFAQGDPSGRFEYVQSGWMKSPAVTGVPNAVRSGYAANIAGKFTALDDWGRANAGDDYTILIGDGQGGWTSSDTVYTSKAAAEEALKDMSKGSFKESDLKIAPIYPIPTREQAIAYCEEKDCDPTDLSAINKSEYGNGGFAKYEAARSDKTYDELESAYWEEIRTLSTGGSVSLPSSNKKEVTEDQEWCATVIPEGAAKCGTGPTYEQALEWCTVNGCVTSLPLSEQKVAERPSRGVLPGQDISEFDGAVKPDN